MKVWEVLEEINLKDYDVIAIYRYVNEIDQWVNLLENETPINIKLPQNILEESVEEYQSDFGELAIYLLHSISELPTKIN